MTPDPPLFDDRTAAGRALAAVLVDRRPRPSIVYGLPRGGVPVAFEVAKALDAPLDLALARKIGAPGAPELAIGAVVDGEHPHRVLNADLARATGADEVFIARESQRAWAELERRRALYLRGRPSPDPKGKTVVVVDDGLATGATAMAAVDGLRARGAARVILAAPVAPPQAAASLRERVDELVCLAEPPGFQGVGQFYRDFHQLTDEEVLVLLDRAEANARR